VSVYRYDERDALIESNRYLCRRAALRFVRRGLELRDLEQVAAIGLIKASRRYDPSSPAPFEAYARVMILGELMHHVRDHEHAVRVPRWVRRLDRRYGAAEEALTARLEREPTRREIAHALGVSPRRLVEVARARNVVLGAAREHHAGPDDLPEPHCSSGYAPAEDRILAERALQALQPLEREIVLGVYALGLTQSEVARRLSLGPRQVYRMHRGALARMHAALVGAPRTRRAC
jgi:RNA polymerase sigma-B factor